MNEEKFYSDEEAEAILREAARLDRPSGAGQSRDRLLATAAELGISPEAVQQAETKVAEAVQTTRDRTEFELSRRSKLREQVMSFVGVSVMLLGINLFTEGFSMNLSSFWSLYAIGIYGFFVLSDLFQFYVRSPARNEAAFAKWREKKHFKEGLMANFMPRRSERHRVDDLLDHYFSIHSTDDRIGAIKAVRESTGLALRESKMLVDEYFSIRGLS